MLPQQQLNVSHLGLKPYEDVWQAMQDFTNTRDKQTSDECWIVEHPSVYTGGRSMKSLQAEINQVPLIKSDRGGQITYHGPGQLVIYTLIQLTRKNLGVRSLVTILESAMINYLAINNVTAYADKDAPGVYVNQMKIGSLGLRIRKGCSYHGLSLNVSMDLTPFSHISPCGLTGMKMTQLADHNIKDSPTQAANSIIENLAKALNYTRIAQTPWRYEIPHKE